MTGEEISTIASFANKEVWIGMSDLAITKLDVPEEMVEFKGDKSDSQRLREVLYVYWEQKSGKKQTFEAFRKVQMSKFIQLIKDKLD